MCLTRRGFMLIEAMAALLLTAALTLAALAALSGLQEQASLVRLRGQATGTALAALQLLRLELASVEPDLGDLVTASPERLVYRAVRGSGVSCGAASDGVLVRAASWRSLRLPSPARDTVLLFHPIHGWEARGLRGPPRAATCPDAAAALLLPLARGPVPADPSVLRTVEVMELRLYQGEGGLWLGVRSVSAGETIQPVLGPLVSRATGFTLLDAAGKPTDVLSGARHLMADLMAVLPAGGGNPRPDPGALRGRVAFRGRAPP